MDTYTGRMAEFNLQRALAGEPVVTVGRHFVTNLFRKDGELHGQFDGGLWITWSLTGMATSRPSDLDLRMAAGAYAVTFMDRVERFLMAPPRRMGVKA